MDHPFPPAELAEYLEHLPVAVWAARADQARVYCNRRWLEFTGRPPEEHLGQGWLAVVHPEDFSGCVSAYRAGFGSGGPFETEYRLKCGDAEYIWILDSAVPRLGPDGQLLGYVGTCIDISARKRIELERERLLDQAEAANRAKDQFLATLSHELRTPLNAIVGWAHMLRSGKLDAATAARAVETIDRNARVQTQLISDILDISRIVTGKMRLNVRPVELLPVVEAALDTVRPSATAKNIRIQPVLDPHAGPVSGDADRLQQVVWNLLSNAIKFTPRNGRVQVRLLRVNSHVEIRVEDTGAGIASEFLPYVFELFRQSDGSTTRQHGGLGLGLALVKHLAELHGGTVAATSPGENKGATFVVKLPIMITSTRPAGSTEDVHPTADSGTPLSGPSLEGVRVLVVDDDADARQLIAAVLHERRAEAEVVGSAAEALMALSERRFDVLVSDIEMPGDDGYALIKKVRALGKDRGGRIPAAALTAYARTEDRMKALLAGFQIHVPKPVQPAELAAVIASLARRK